MVIRVGVHGAGGKMGVATVAAIDAADDLEVVATVGRDDELRAFADAGCEVVVDFTVAASARVLAPWLAMHGIHAVIGTSGITPDDLAAFGAAFGSAEQPGSANCIVVPNFAITSVLVQRFAELAAPFFDTAEIIEFHHNTKVDAPSGAAIVTAERMAAARGDVPWAPDPTQHESLPGARGGLGPGGIRVHGVRMVGMLAHEEVIFGLPGQTLTLRNDSIDRQSYMPGVLLACRRVGELPGVTVGLDRLLGI